MNRRQRIFRPEQPIRVDFTDDSVIVTLADGRVMHPPLADFPWLNQASAEQRNRYELDPFSIYWPDWDDGIDVDWLIDQQANQTETRPSDDNTQPMQFTTAESRKSTD